MESLSQQQLIPCRSIFKDGAKNKNQKARESGLFLGGPLRANVPQKGPRVGGDHEVADEVVEQEEVVEEGDS
jgi:hypothetical protein